MPTPDKVRPFPNPTEVPGGLHYPGGVHDPRRPVPADPNRARGYYIPNHGDNRGERMPLPPKQQWEERI